ncbi:MAG: hypothetical protein IJP54_05625 [Synergistaceae bacterium]|nr:hypothetical protein [Synergistaceae bacterium]MBR0035134.1 hypothetical protein [Synergistaceae bacterium]
MSTYEQLAADFFTKYEYPDIEPLTVGFSDIDPPKKIFSSDIDHEQLDGLLGGDDINGHWHLTRELWEFVVDLVGTKDFDGGFAATTDDEYLLNVDDWFDAGFADTNYLTSEDDWADGGGVIW